VVSSTGQLPTLKPTPSLVIPKATKKNPKFHFRKHFYSYKLEIHTDRLTLLLRILYYCTQIVQMDCTSVYTNVNCCSSWRHTYTHLWCTHYAWISCTTVRLYSSPVCDFRCEFCIITLQTNFRPKNSQDEPYMNMNLLTLMLKSLTCCFGLIHTLPRHLYFKNAKP
jgi:hypothetical protein